MNINDIKESFIQGGFTWTMHLEEFMRAYAGKTFQYPHPRAPGLVEAAFYDEGDARRGPEIRFVALVTEKLGEEAAPVGQCNNRNIDLLLSVSGRLVAYAHDTMFCWSFDPPPNWQQSVDNILQSQPPQFVAHLDDDEDDEEQAD